MDLNHNSTFHQTLQAIIQNTVRAMTLPELAIGTVETVGPLSIRVSSDFLIPGDALLLTETVCYKQVDLTHTHPNTGVGLQNGATVVTAAGNNSPQGANIMLNRDLQVGDKVLMLRVMSGQQYIILSKVVNA
jgi:hypothetical protein